MGSEKLIALFGTHIDGGLSAIPLSFVVGRDGSLLSVVKGIRSSEEFEKLIQQSLQSRP
ncbi:MAG: hypothetical protein HQ516_05660 [Chlorobium sp.]|nr:hypothetical protein [Chlorobium phaeovibrioides]NQU46515.1 hypothetical protein [Chlorobium sp.]